MKPLLEDEVIRLFSHERQSTSLEPMLACLPADYVNALSFGYHQATGGSEESRRQLTQAARVAAFYRFSPIFSSISWQTRVLPRLKTAEDWVRAMLDLMPALGFGEWEVIQLVPDEQLIVAVKNGYEAEGYLKNIGTRPGGGVCFFNTTLAAGVMNLVYGTALCSGKPISEEEFIALFDSAGGFSAEELECSAEGRQQCKIIVGKN